MDFLKELEIFLAVGRTQSFTMAARRFGISKSTVTKRISALEERAGAKLLHRNNKTVDLTEAGRSMMEHANQILHHVDRAMETITHSVNGQSGTIRLSCTPALSWRILSKAFIAFKQRMPKVDVLLLHDNGGTRVVGEGIDLCIRPAMDLQDTSAIMRVLDHVPQHLVATPEYLARRGTPRTITDLLNHNCLLHSLRFPSDVWEFNTPEGLQSVRIHGDILSDMSETLLAIALQGHGISRHPAYMVEDALATGQLVKVLPDYECPKVAIHAVFPHRDLPLRVRLFLDFLSDYFAGDEKVGGPALTGIPWSEDSARDSVRVLET